MQGNIDNEFDREWIIQWVSSRINDVDEAELWVSRQHDSSRITVTVRAASVLDLRIFDLMHRAFKFAKAYKAVRMIVDLGRTHRIQDSGLASLLLLKENLGEQIEKIRLINAGHLKYDYLNCLPETFVIN